MKSKYTPQEVSTKILKQSLPVCLHLFPGWAFNARVAGDPQFSCCAYVLFDPSLATFISLSPKVSVCSCITVDVFGDSQCPQVCPFRTVLVLV